MQIVGVVVFALCVVQLLVGTFTRLRRQPREKAHPARNIIHVLLGLVIIGLSLVEVRLSLPRVFGTAADAPPRTSNKVFTGIRCASTLSTNSRGLFTIGCIIWTTVSSTLLIWRKG